MLLESLAPVKVNLCLHVGKTRDDGYHELSSLAVFPEIGDRVAVEPDDCLSLTIDGPFASDLHGLSAEDNLVIKAAKLLQNHSDVCSGARIKLTKNVPAAGGIGGGTSDAACALILLRSLWQLSLSDEELVELSFQIGADGPVCLLGQLTNRRSVIMRGAGEHVEAGPMLPPLWMCLANPNVPVATGEVFKRFDMVPPQNNATLLPTMTSLPEFLRLTRNDLAIPAEQICPAIQEVRTFLSGTTGCLGERMSGSGATCFALYESAADAQQAARNVQKNDWWGVAAPL